MAKRIYMREHPDFQLGGAEFPMPKIVIGGYAPLACPTLDGLWMKASEDGGSSGAIEKRFDGLKWTGGYGGSRSKSIARR
jgi:hypothetical protein